MFVLVKRWTKGTSMKLLSLTGTMSNRFSISSSFNLMAWLITVDSQTSSNLLGGLRSTYARYTLATGPFSSERTRDPSLKNCGSMKLSHPAPQCGSLRAPWSIWQWNISPSVPSKGKVASVTLLNSTLTLHRTIYEHRKKFKKRKEKIQNTLMETYSEKRI